VSWVTVQCVQQSNHSDAVRGTPAIDLGTLGGKVSTAFAINDHGQVVGWSLTADDEQHAFSWTAAGDMVDLGTLGGSSSEAFAVNSSGLVVGFSSSSSRTYVLPHGPQWPVQ
jgi:probable HAF family extracellular repeat protein